MAGGGHMGWKEILREGGEKMLRVAICDDDPNLLEEIHRKAQDCFSANKILALLTDFQEGRHLLYEIEDGAVFDLLLLDIEMPGMDGLELSGRIREYLPECLIIFVTSHFEYAVDGYELNIFRYIPKQQLEGRLQNGLLDAASYLSIQNKASYIIDNQNRIERILLRDVLYISHENKNSVFHMTGRRGRGTALCRAGGKDRGQEPSCCDGAMEAAQGKGEAGKNQEYGKYREGGEDREYRVRKSLAQILEEMDSEDFFMIDRGCIVNLSHVSSVRNNVCVMNQGTTLPVAQSRIRALKETLHTYWNSRL